MLATPGALPYGSVNGHRFGRLAPLPSVPVTATQIATLRTLHTVRKAAQDRYHACLSTGAPTADRHAAEADCRAAVKAIADFTATL